MSAGWRNWLDGHKVVALGLILAGVLLLIPHFGYAWDLDLFDLWPCILILVGISTIAKGGPRTLEGVLWILFGLLFLGNELGLIHFRFRNFWPLALIAAGALLLTRKGPGLSAMGSAGRGKGDGEAADARLETFWLLGGSPLRVDSRRFRGGDVVSLLSSGTVDLRKADMESEASVEVLSLLGKVTFLVPEHWEVLVQGTSILGNMKQERTPASAPRSGAPKRLIVKGLAFLGDVEIR